MKYFIKKLKKISIFIVVIFIFCGALTVSAQDGYVALEPLPNVNAGVDGGTFAGYLQNVFDLGIGIAIALAVVMLVWGGAEYLSTDAVFGKEDAKEKIWGALWGLILALGIVIILKTINPEILKLNLRLDKLTPSPTVTPAPVGTSDAQVSSVFSEDATVRARLENDDVTINKSACTSVDQSNCTNVGGLPEQTISGLLALKADCECGITVTGGTEYWLHSSHGPGQRTVDLAPSSSLNQFLGRPNPVSGTSVTKMGATFKYENVGDNANATGGHWHVTNL
ncbi:MAG: hypothetical protein A2648_01045 [Candidatus Lloydbacteria bacterium RIFCSPHIGHO2_01_FULL_41_20]|uniref:Uncharacterized protein n=1 Tax=Candidatus Lloydbacteria bacterium RIFCSPHIGHO2_01_FULL_41_20 TaxID=1798657 RepID=A0A1G2CSE7_9BACT|nr:MAG: hypothetical protein A2648_01045 [Candidatus Lloydbacteria bacterium RIFCSPHIGHO2_01_FULL_41_20]